MRRFLIVLYWKFFDKNKYGQYKECERLKYVVAELKRKHEKYSHIQKAYYKMTAYVELNFKSWR